TAARDRSAARRRRPTEFRSRAGAREVARRIPAHDQPRHRSVAHRRYRADAGARRARAQAAGDPSRRRRRDKMTGSIDPTRPQFEAFKALPRDEPIHMLNLIRLKKVATYPEGHPNHGKGLSGLDAYRAYGRTSAEIF